MHELSTAWFASWHWLQEILGINIGIPGHTPRWYNFNSGSGSDIQELAIVGMVAGTYKHNKCAKCWRPTAHFKVKGTHKKTCHKHTTPAIHKAIVTKYKRSHPVQHEFIKKIHGKEE